MFARLYQNIVIEKPKLIFVLLILCLIGFGYYTKDFRLDASSDTLLIDGDPDAVSYTHLTLPTISSV